MRARAPARRHAACRFRRDVRRRLSGICKRRGVNVFSIDVDAEQHRRAVRRARPAGDGLLGSHARRPCAAAAPYRDVWKSMGGVDDQCRCIRRKRAIRRACRRRRRRARPGGVGREVGDEGAVVRVSRARAAAQALRCGAALCGAGSHGKPPLARGVRARAVEAIWPGRREGGVRLRRAARRRAARSAARAQHGVDRRALPRHGRREAARPANGISVVGMPGARSSGARVADDQESGGRRCRPARVRARQLVAESTTG